MHLPRKRDPAPVPGQALRDDTGGLVCLHKKRHRKIVLLRQRRIDKTRRADLAADVHGVEIEFEARRHVDECGFRCAIGGALGQAAIAGGRGNHDKLPFSGGLHVVDAGHHAVCDAKEIDGQGLVERVVIEPESTDRIEVAGIEDGERQ